MPWNETSRIDERARFVAEYLNRTLGIAPLCRVYGISRKTGYKWIARSAEDGEGRLADRSREARTHPNAVDAEVEEWVLRGRDLHPTWGPKKLVAWALRESGRKELCAVSTAGEILKRHGLTVRRKLTRKGEPFMGELKEGATSNELWCVDFKGHFKVGNGSRCDPLTITDACSRYILKCQSLEHTGHLATRRVFEAAFRQYGLPARIRSDNGAPFSSIGIGGLSVLSVWWIKLGITPERIAPGKPCQNGRHERMHLTLKKETATPPAYTLRDQQRRFDAFRIEFNDHRPHEALGQMTPSMIYQQSARNYSGRTAPVEYPEGSTTRRVQGNGVVYWENKPIFIGEALAREDIAFEPKADGQWEIRFAHIVLGTFDEKKRLFRPKTAWRRRGRAQR